jgi:hypothetical protein
MQVFKPTCRRQAMFSWLVILFGNQPPQVSAVETDGILNSKVDAVAQMACCVSLQPQDSVPKTGKRKLFLQNWAS